MVPIDVDEQGQILDGHHRHRAWVELHKNEPPPIIVREGLSEQEKRAFARKNNILRRHLTREQVRRLIAEQLEGSRRSGRTTGSPRNLASTVRPSARSGDDWRQLRRFRSWIA